MKVTVQSVTGTPCPRGNVVGKSWMLADGLTPDGMCTNAYISIILETQKMRYAQQAKDITLVACPDPKHLVVYEVQILKPPSV